MIFLRWKRFAANKAWHFQPKIPSFQPHAFLVIFASFVFVFMHALGWPLDPTLAYLVKNVFYGSCCSNIHGKRAAQGWQWVHTSSHYKTWRLKLIKRPFALLALLWATFSFLSHNVSGGMKLHWFQCRNRVLFQVFFFSFFLPILPVHFASGFLAHFAHFAPSPWVTLHHLWPQIVLFMSPEPIQPIGDIANWIHQWFWMVSVKMVIFPFLVIWPVRTPLLDRCTKHLGAEGPHLRVPPLLPGPTPSPNLWQHFSSGGDSDSPHQVVLGIY